MCVCVCLQREREIRERWELTNDQLIATVTVEILERIEIINVEFSGQERCVEEGCIGLHELEKIVAEHTDCLGIVCKMV